MKRNSKILAGIAASALVALALAGCTGSDDGSTRVSMAMLNSYQPGMDPLIEQFEAENPTISIDVDYYSADVYDKTVPTQFAGGNGSDLVYLLADTGVTGVPKFAAAGYLLDLSAESWVDTMYEATKAGYSADGDVLARDLGISALAVMSYNVDYFDEHSLTVPTTFDELLDVCAAIKSDGSIPIAWAAASGPVNWNNVASLAGNTVLGDDQTWLADLLDGSTSFADTPGWREAVDQVFQMQDAGCFSPGAASESLDQMLGQFGSGQAQMMFTYGGLNGAVLQTSPDLNIDMFAPPAVDAEDTWLTVQPAGGIAIWKDSPHADEAKLFLDFISGEDQSRQLADTNQLISPVDATANEIPALYAGLRPYFESGRTITAIVSDFPNASIMYDKAGASIQGLFTGQRTTEQALQDFDAAAATE